VSIASVAVVALLLMTSIGGSSATPAAAVVSGINSTTTKIAVDTYAQLQVDAEDDNFCFPNCSSDDVEITASAGDFISFDPTGFPFNTNGCYDNLITPCETFFYTTVDSNGFGDNGLDGDHCDSLTGTGDTDIAISTDGTGCGPTPDLDTTHLEQWWQAPPGFDGGKVTFCAHQGSSVQCSAITVVGPIASLKLFAFRHDTTEKSVCEGTPVYVIAAAEYTFNDNTTFNNDRADLCVEARDSNNSMVFPVDIIWTTTVGILDGPVTTTCSTDVNCSENHLRSGGSAHSGDIATVTASAGSASASVKVQFGGDPASCSMPDIGTLDIGDTAHVVATFLDAAGNWVPDGIVGHLEEVDSGDGADNVQFVSVSEDTVKGAIEGDVIGAISGLTTVAASIEHLAGPDPVCSDEIELTGDVHITPVVCDDPDMILNGFPPPAGGGFGTFEFCGGTYDQLFDASNCPGPESTSLSAFFYNKPSGSFAVWIPGSTVAAANAEFMTIFPNQDVPIPPGTIFTAKCK